MTKPYNINIKPAPKIPPLRSLQMSLNQDHLYTLNINNQTYYITIHDNGIRNDNTKRKRKVLVYSTQGLVSARRFFYHLYHPRWNGQGKIIHKDQDDLNFHKSNLVRLTQRECNNLVHFNNPYLKTNKYMAAKLLAIKVSIAIKEGGEKNEGI